MSDLPGIIGASTEGGGTGVWWGCGTRNTSLDGGYSVAPPTE